MLVFLFSLFEWIFNRIIYLFILGLQNDFDLDMDFSKTKKKKKKKKDIDELVAEGMDKKGDKTDDSKCFSFYSWNKVNNPLYVFIEIYML